MTTDEQTKTNTEETPKVEVKNTDTAQRATNTDRKTDNRKGKNDRKGRRGGQRDRQPKEFEESIIGIDRVTRVTAGGRQMRFRATIVIGDRKGRIGYGSGKASEVINAVKKAVVVAKKNLFVVPIYKDSLPHAVITKYKATKIILLPAPEGKGVIAGGAVRQILDLAGVQNVMSKLHGSRNKINVVMATMKALKMLQNQAPVESKNVEDKKEDTKEISQEKIVEKPVKNTTKKPTKKTIKK